MKTNIKTSAKSKASKFNIPTTHITTLAIGSMRPSNIVPACAGDKFDIDYTQFSRLSPLVVPTFGSVALKTYAFFVPHRVVWREFEDFMVNTPDLTLGVSYTRPRFSLRDLWYAITGNNQPQDPNFTTSRFISSASAGAYDFAFKDITSNTTYYFKFTSQGRMLYNTLCSLGYNIPLYYEYNDNFDSNGVESKILQNTILNGIPLLSYARVLYDYIYPSQYIQQQQLGYLFTDSLNDGGVDAWITDVIDMMMVCYEQDFFTSLWSKPNQVASGSNASSWDPSVVTVPDGSNIDTDTANVQSLANTQARLVSGDGATLLNGYNSSGVTNSFVYNLSSNALQWLQSVSDFCLRNNIGGTRFHEWMKAHFGFVTQPQDSDRSIFLKSWSDDVKISDVTDTSGDSRALGSLAGKGMGYGNGKLKFEAKEHGFIIFVSVCIPRTGYYQGVAPWCLDMDKREKYFIPEFDAVGLEGVPRSAVAFSARSAAELDISKPTHWNNAFGFAPRYSWLYKTGHDILSGDFRLGSRNTGLDSYHTFRNVFYGKDAQNNPLALDANFLSVDNQFERIFSSVENTTQITDTLFTIFQFNITKYSHMLPIGDSFPLWDKSGRDVNVNYQGTQLT